MPNTTGSSAIARHERDQVGKLLALRSEKLVADLGRLQRAGVILVLDNQGRLTPADDLGYTVASARPRQRAERASRPDRQEILATGPSINLTVCWPGTPSKRHHHISLLKLSWRAVGHAEPWRNRDPWR